MLDSLRDYQHVMVAAILVLLLYTEWKRSGKSVTVSGFTAGSTLGHMGTLSHTGSVGANARQPGNVQDELLAEAVGPEAMGNAMEAPVFWNAGSFARVNKEQQEAAAQGVEGMRGGYVDRMHAAPEVLGQNLDQQLY